MGREHCTLYSDCLYAKYYHETSPKAFSTDFFSYTPPLTLDTTKDTLGTYSLHTYPQRVLTNLILIWRTGDITFYIGILLVEETITKHHYKHLAQLSPTIHRY